MSARKKHLHDISKFFYSCELEYRGFGFDVLEGRSRYRDEYDND